MLALCLAIGVPVGAVIGLFGALIGGALLLGLIAGYLVLSNLMLGLIALVGIICLLPFAALPVDIGFSPTFLDLIMGAVFFVWISRLVTHQDGEFVAPALTLPVLGFLFLAFVSFIFGLGHARLTANVLRHFGEIVLSILLFLLVVNTIRTKADLQVMVLALIAAGFLAALIGIVLYVLPTNTTVRLLSMLRVVRYPSGPSVLRYIEENPQLALRATSTSVDPNVLGGMLIFVTTLTVTQLLAQRPIIPRKWLAVAAAVMGVAMLLTFSRGSFAGLAGALGLMAVLRYRKFLWIGLAVIALILILPVTQTYVQHYLEGVQGHDLATQMRFGEYKDAIRLISRYPWFGVGFAGAPDIDTYIGVSCVYLLIAEEMGLVGLSAFLVVLASFIVGFFGALRRCVAGSDLEPLLLGTSLAVAGAMVGGLLDHYLFNLVFPHASSLLWMMIGLGTVARRLVVEEAEAAAA